ncbi:MAG TPA: NnrS family protein [Candidatus Sulfotelmatobacter sp.]|jgi:uncharacterized protein involved in response to NO|nr:NnrS family protein [Candidatus Sulfotelmatobacter sp.]
MLIQIEQPGKAAGGLPVLRAGFRPFFLLAGLQAALMVPLWLLFMSGGGAPAVTPLLWHGHEMLFGFGTAAVCGFLLTAVPNWTGAPGVKGTKLAALAGLWIAARIGFLGGLPLWLAALCDILLLPALGGLLALPLIRAGKVRNMMFLFLLSLLTLCDGLLLSEMLGVSQLGRTGLYGGIFMLIMMIGVIGGRIIPGFTQNGLRMKGISVQTVSRPWLEKASLAALALSAASWLALPSSVPAGSLCLLAAVLHLVRLTGWKGWKTGPVPLLWILHIGYLWVPVGLALLGLSALMPGIITPQTAVHALTAGAIGSMIIGVMSRAALGHGGRPLEPAKATVAAYVLVQLGAFVRVFGVLADAHSALLLSGALWSLGFAVFAVVYAPVCLLPRQDGKPG